MKVDTVLIIIACILLVVAVVFLPKSCVPSAKYEQLKAQHDALLVEYNNLKIESADEIAKYEADKKAQDAAIAAANAEISNKNNTIAGLDKKTKELEAAFANLPDDAAKVVNLQAQVQAWKDKFAVAEGIIADKDKVIFSITAKYDAQVKITDRKSTRLNSSHSGESRMPSSA